jgi:hypothetical protein
MKDKDKDELEKGYSIDEIMKTFGDNWVVIAEKCLVFA